MRAPPSRQHQCMCGRLALPPCPQLWGGLVTPEAAGLSPPGLDPGVECCVWSRASVPLHCTCFLFSATHNE